MKTYAALVTAVQQSVVMSFSKITVTSGFEELIAGCPFELSHVYVGVSSGHPLFLCTCSTSEI